MGQVIIYIYEFMTHVCGIPIAIFTEVFSWRDKAIVIIVALPEFIWLIFCCVIYL